MKVGNTYICDKCGAKEDMYESCTFVFRKNGNYCLCPRCADKEWEKSNTENSSYQIRKERLIQKGIREFPMPFFCV